MKERGISFRGDTVRAVGDGRKNQTRRAVNESTLRVSLPRAVYSDSLPRITARPGVYRASMNPQGAVTLIMKDGTELGLRPGEFNFRCPYASGTTELVDLGGGTKRWRIRPDPDQRLWVRETIRLVGRAGDSTGSPYGADDDLERDLAEFAADGAATMLDTWPWKHKVLPSIHLPRGLSRFTLAVVDVRIERLQDITDSDAIAEGARCFDDIPDLHPYKQGSRWSMEANPPPSTEHCLGSPRFAFANYYQRIHGEGAWDENGWVWVVSFLKLAQEREA
jgi:hypothetical protein